MKIYTKGGDAGTSSLFNGERRPKTDASFAALGDVDELNASLGVAYEACRGSVPEIEAQLPVVMSRLLDVGSAVATPCDAAATSAAKLARVEFAEEHAAVLETWIDVMDQELEPLTVFILPAGGAAAAHLHVARAVCRRAERAVFALIEAGSCPTSVGVYLNRLSDYLFTAARLAAKRTGNPEVKYKKA